MRALSIAASGMQAQQLNVDVISHNIANMNTTGYKRQRAEFQDMLYQNMERPGSTSSASGSILPLGIQIGVGVRAARRYFQTGETFDAATALRLGLVQELVTIDQLDPAVERQIERLLDNGPRALREAKRLALRVGGRSLEAAQALDQENATLIARLRVSPEGQEGLSAFLEKRKPQFL